MRQTFNYHTHTYRCKHAYGTDEEYIEAAIKAGYKILGFSDHAPYRDYPSESSHMDWEQLDEYLSTITTLKDKYKDQIDIRIGFETEYFSFDHDERLELRNKVDYLLLGQHFQDPVGKTVSYFKQNTDEEIREYGRSVCEALDTRMFLYLAHPDVFMNRQTEFNETCQSVAHMICQKCVETGTPMEINVRGTYKGKKPFINSDEQFYYPHRDFWKIASEYPVKVLFGVDAHHPNDLTDLNAIEAGYNEIKDLNLDFIKEPLF